MHFRIRLNILYRPTRLYVVISFNLCPQVKSHVGVQGQPNDNDKGYVSIGYNTYVTGLYYKRSDEQMDGCAYLV